MPPTSSNSVAQARLREALNAGGPGAKEKGPPVADGLLSVTPDTPEAIEFRSRQSVIDSLGVSSSSYLEDETGPKPSELYGKFTWKIENFSEIGKRELRSTIFEVGSYKWYILVYPQGCDVCNHLSLFLCVADYDKLLPGWSHFAQFTIAVVNKDPKKSKYSDTLHRFCKKEHDWGWKKFMELNKVLEGFTVNNTLVIKAQVQVIRDRPNMPFRCLDAQYRRELVRVYLTNVETICRKFVDEKRESLAMLREDSKGFRRFLGSLDPSRKRNLASEKGEVVMKGVVKRFFNEKEVTSTLVMDALFSGCKQLEEAGKISELKRGKRERAGAVIHADKHVFSFAGDLSALLDRAATETVPPFRDDKASDQLSHRNAQDVDDYSRDYVERDERRLADLGRRAVEMYAISHIFSELQGVHSEAESIKLQDALIKEEEEAERLEDQRQASRLAAERERKARKKERRRAKKVAEELQEAERRSHDADELNETASESSSKQRKETSPSNAQSSGAGPSTLKAPSPSSALPPQTSSSSYAQSDHAAARTAKAETTGRPPSLDESRAARHSQATARSSNDNSDDDDSSTSRSGSDDKPVVSTQQFKDHIEYLKGELARATSQLNAARSELVASGESLMAAHSEVSLLKGELGLAKAELANRAQPLVRDSERPMPALSMQTMASSFSQGSKSLPFSSEPKPMVCSTVNVAEDTSLVSSLDNDTPSQAESQDPLVDSFSGQTSQQDPQEVLSSGEMSNGSVPYSRKSMWNGGHGPPYQDSHNGNAGPLLHQHPHLLNTRSKSGQLAGVRQPPPPPPPPSDPRGSSVPRNSNMSRQTSAPQPKDGSGSIRQQQSRSQPHQQGWAVSNGGHPGQKRSDMPASHRQAGKVKVSLNGNAPSFVPGSGTATTSMNGGTPNGVHPISYRNVAAGLLSAASLGEVAEQGSVAGKGPKQVATGKGRNLGLNGGSMPATPRSSDLGPPALANGTGDGSLSPTAYPVKALQHQPSESYSSSQAREKKAESNGPTESAGLDDFAHMGLINDLLE